MSCWICDCGTRNCETDICNNRLCPTHTAYTSVETVTKLEQVGVEDIFCLLRNVRRYNGCLYDKYDVDELLKTIERKAV